MITIALLLLLGQAPQQPPPQQAPPPTPPASPTTTAEGRSAPASDDYIIGVQDVLNVNVFGEPDASRTGITVDNDGTIDCAYIGRVQVAGLSTRAVEKEIRDRLEKGGYLVKPAVSVEVVKYRSKSVFVQGQVRGAGQIILEGNMSLTTVLAKAGSMTLDAATYVIVSRPGPNGTVEQFRVSRQDIESGKAQSIMLKDGDTVLVPKAETFFVNGEVRSPGTYTWDEGLTLERALTMAGGLGPRAGSITIERGKTMIKKAKKSEIIQANDTIRVGTRIF